MEPQRGLLGGRTDAASGCIAIELLAPCAVWAGCATVGPRRLAGTSPKKNGLRWRGRLRGATI